MFFTPPSFWGVPPSHHRQPFRSVPQDEDDFYAQPFWAPRGRRTSNRRAHPAGDHGSSPLFIWDPRTRGLVPVQPVSLPEEEPEPEPEPVYFGNAPSFWAGPSSSSHRAAPLRSPCFTTVPTRSEPHYPSSAPPPARAAQQPAAPERQPRVSVPSSTSSASVPLKGFNRTSRAGELLFPCLAWQCPLVDCKLCVRDSGSTRLGI